MGYIEVIGDEGKKWDNVCGDEMEVEAGGEREEMEVVKG